MKRFGMITLFHWACIVTVVLAVVRYYRGPDPLAKTPEPIAQKSDTPRDEGESSKQILRRNVEAARRPTGSDRPCGRCICNMGKVGQ